MIHRDRTRDEKRVVSEVSDSLEEYLNRVETGICLRKTSLSRFESGLRSS